MYHFKPSFSRPRKIRLTYGSIFDYKGELINLSERNLDGECEVLNQHGQAKGHNWLLLPQEKDQKEYVICLDCFERSHL